MIEPDIVRPLVIVFDHDTHLAHEVMESLRHGSWQLAPCRDLDEAHALARDQRPSAVIGCWPGGGSPPDTWARLLRSAEYPLLNEVPLMLLTAAGRPAPSADTLASIGAGAMLTLPPDTPLIQQRLERLIQDHPPTGLRHILLAMQTDPAVDALSGLFTAGGHQVCHDDRLPAAARMAAFDAVIVDLDLETCPHTALAALPPPEYGTVLLVVTSRADPRLAQVSVEAGAFAHVRKPYTAQYLHHLCGKALAKRLDDQLQALYQRRTHELRHAQNLLASLLDAPGNLAVLADPDGRIVSANHAALQVCRDVFGSELILGRSADTWLPPAVWRRLRRDSTAATRARGHRRTLEFLDPPGRRRWFDLTITPVRSGNGQVRHLAYHAVELTERHLARTELRLRNEALAHISQGVVISTPARRIIYANPGFTRLTGYPLDEVIDRSTTLLYGADTDSAGVRSLEDAWSTGTTAELRLLCYRRDGTAFWNEIKVTPVRESDQQLVHFITTHHDVTDRHLAEVELKTSQQRLQALFDHSGDGIVLLDNAGICLEANPTACQLSGYSRSQMVGQALVAFAPASQRETLANQFAWFLIAGTLRTDLTLRRADDTPRRVECNAIAHIQPDVHLAIIRDVTEKRAMTEQLAHHQRRESVGLLANGVAHSLNNILTPLLMVPDMLRALPQVPQAFNLLKVMETGAHRGAKVVRQLMAFSQSMPGDKRLLDLVDLAHQTVTVMMETFPREITWDWTPLPEPCLVSGNEEQLRQVLVELLINSRDAMPGGGRLAVTLRPRQLREADLPSLPPEAHLGAYLELAVADQGGGIAPEALDKIFDPFFTTKPFGQGSGLGLSTALGLVKEHGGFIHVQSRSGRGTAVRVFVPTLPEVAPPSARPPESRSGEARTVLVVDDEDWICELARTVLMQGGFRVICAPHADAALFQVQKLDALPDLLITDLSMPGMTGQQFIPRFRQRYPAVPIMVMTGLDLKRALTEEVRALVVATIPKPFTGPQLRNQVEAALGAIRG